MGADSNGSLNYVTNIFIKDVLNIVQADYGDFVRIFWKFCDKNGHTPHFMVLRNTSAIFNHAISVRQRYRAGQSPELIHLELQHMTKRTREFKSLDSISLLLTPECAASGSIGVVSSKYVVYNVRIEFNDRGSSFRKSVDRKSSLQTDGTKRSGTTRQTLGNRQMSMRRLETNDPLQQSIAIQGHPKLGVPCDGLPLSPAESPCYPDSIANSTSKTARYSSGTLLVPESRCGSPLLSRTQSGHLSQEEVKLRRRSAPVPSYDPHSSARSPKLCRNWSSTPETICPVADRTSPTILTEEILLQQLKDTELLFAGERRIKDLHQQRLKHWMTEARKVQAEAENLAKSASSQSMTSSQPSSEERAPRMNTEHRRSTDCQAETSQCIIS